MINETATRPGLPPTSVKDLAAALEDRLRVHHDSSPALTAEDLLEVAGKREVLDALWESGLLTLPGGRPSPRLYREPSSLPTREQLAGEVAEALDPILRKAALANSNGSAWVGEQSPRDLCLEASFDDLVDAAWQAGLLTFNHTDDRAHLRAGWAAMGTALVILSRHEDLPADLLARVPKSHVGYLLGQQVLRQHAREAWARIEAAKVLAVLMRDVGDVDYIRANLGVLHRLLTGEAPWDTTEPRDGSASADGSLYDAIRHRAVRVAVDAERLFAAIGQTMIDEGSTGQRTEHLFAQRTARYAWAVAVLLGFIRDSAGDDTALGAALLVDQVFRFGEVAYVDDVPVPDPDPAASVLAGTDDDPARLFAAKETLTAGSLGARLPGLALDLWRRSDWRPATAALPEPLRELLADAADRAIVEYNGEVQADGYSGMRPVDRWWRTDQTRTERVCRFLGGPRHGYQTTEPAGIVPQHCRPRQDGPVYGTGFTWADAASWPGEERYAPEGYDDRCRLLMVWRPATPEEIADAEARREDRDRDRAEEIVLDEAAAAAAGEDGPA
jgi:hypothetical protein